LRKRGQQSGAGARSARRALDEEFVTINDPEHQRRNREGSESEPPVDPEHQDSHPGQQQRVAAEGGDAARNEVLDRLNVRRQPRCEVARPLRVVETQGQTLHMGEQVPPQVINEKLADFTD